MGIFLKNYGSSIFFPILSLSLLQEFISFPLQIVTDGLID